MAYVYSHIRIDRNEIFYIGIGSDSQGEYYRAYSKKGRGKFWKDMTINREYLVKILYDNISWITACKLEIDLIKLYGRRDLGLGTLVNLTNGGEGINGYIHTPEELLRLSRNSQGSNNGNAKKCIHFDTNLRFGSLKEGCIKLNLSYKQQVCAVREQLSTAQFYYEYKPFIKTTRKDVSKNLGKLRIGNKNSMHHPIIHIASRIEYPSIEEACRQLNLVSNTERQRMNKNLINKKFELLLEKKGNKE